MTKRINFVSQMWRAAFPITVLVIGVLLYVSNTPSISIESKPDQNHVAAPDVASIAVHKPSSLRAKGVAVLDSGIELIPPSADIPVHGAFEKLRHGYVAA